LVAALALTLLASSLTTNAFAATPVGAAEAAPSATGGTVPRPDHVVVVMLENKDRSAVVGSPQAEYLNELATRGANMSESFGVAHPSQPNYIALFSGSQQGVTSNDCRDLGSAPNLGSQLEQAGLSFTGYAESLPKVGYTGCVSGEYKRKHNPWVSFSNLSPQVNQPFSAFPSDYTQLPTVSFVTPNMCHDMHDCSIATGDHWVKDQLDDYARWAVDHNSLLVVTFDENSGGASAPIASVLVGANVKPGVYSERMDHYTLLRTLEDAYGLAPLGNAADAAPLQTIWNTSSTPPPAAVPAGITNGDFEAKLDAWTLSGSTFSSVHHHQHGLRSGRVGSTSATKGDSILSQTFTVAEGQTRLSAWWKGHCSDRVDRAWATVVLTDETSGTVSTPLAPTCQYTNEWQQVGGDVTAGHTYTVQLVNRDDGHHRTANRTYFDNVELS